MKNSIALILLFISGFCFGQQKLVFKEMPESNRNQRLTNSRPSGNSSIAPLKIGEQLPELTFTNLVNSAAKSITTSQFKGKYLILDFWSTYCTSCLAHMPENEQLQKEFADDVNFLLVDSRLKGETKPNIIRALRRLDEPGKSKFSLPSVIDDTVLAALFPHVSVPHYVWIDRNGKLLAITSRAEVNKESLTKLIAGNNAPKYQKIDIDEHRPLFTIAELPLNELQHFSILLKGQFDGLNGNGVQFINDTARGIKIVNSSLLSLYQRVMLNTIPGFADGRLVLEVKDPVKIAYNSTSGLSEHDWNRQNHHSYELVVPHDQMDKVYDYMLEDLNRYTSYLAKVEKRKTLCWSLEKVGPDELIRTKGNTYANNLQSNEAPVLSNNPLIALVVYINKLSGGAIVVDQTNFKENIDLVFKAKPTDMNSLAEQLKPFGLKLIQTYVDLDMLVIRDK